MYVRLREPWCLRGYGRQLCALERRGESGAVETLTPALFSLLMRCDGITQLEETPLTTQAISLYAQRGVVERLDRPAPMQAYQAYVHHPHRRVIAAAVGITGRCNLRCRHCFLASGTGVPPQEFTLEELQSLFAQIAACGMRHVQLTGGEPLLHPQFPQVLQAIRQNDLRLWRLFTNGLLLTEDILAQFRALDMQPEIVISFDGLGSHDWMRGMPGAEAKALRAIALGVENGFPVRACMNLNRRTLPRAVESARLLFSMGVRSIFFVRTSEAKQWMEQGEGTLSPDEYCETILALTRELRAENRQGLNFQFFNVLDIPPNVRADDIGRYRENRLFPHPSGSAWCQKCIDTIFIAGDGRVLPCDAFEGSSLAGGFLQADNNVHRRPLADILADSQYAQAMLVTTRDVARNAPCASCELWESCRGGPCRACAIAAAAIQSGSFLHGEEHLDGPSFLLCRFMRGGYLARLKAILRGEAP